MTRVGQDPVSILITRRMRSGMERHAGSLARDLSGIALAFPGCQSVRHIEPEKSLDGSFFSLLQFDSVESLASWETSEVRERWLEHINHYVEDGTILTPVTGLENLFQMGSLDTQRRPRRYKMAIVLVVVIYSLLMLSRYLLGPLVAGMPGWLQTLVLVCTQVTLMTYLVMPWLTRRLAGWLQR